MNLLTVENVYAGYGNKEILKAVSLQVEEGQMVGLLGQNGCGKSTLIKALCKGISYRGEVSVAGKDLKILSERELARLCTYVPQRSGLSIDITVLETVLMGFHPYLRMLESPDGKMKEKAKNILSLAGLEKEIASNYMELSEGQKRLCILARSLVADAKVLFMDEPDAALDFSMRNHIMQVVKNRVQKNKDGALLALHDVNLALSFCDCIYLMKQGEIVDCMYPSKDAVTEMEKKLSDLYGDVRLLSYETEGGAKKLVMVQK